MYTSEYTVVVNKPIDFVFANATCMKGCINWVSGMRSTEKIGTEPLQVGTQYKHVASFMGMTGEALITVSVYDPPHEFAFDDNEVSQLPVANHYTFTEVPGGTSIHHTMTLTPRQNLFGRVSAALMVSTIQTQMRHNLDTLKSMLEEGVVVQAQD